MFFPLVEVSFLTPLLFYRKLRKRKVMAEELEVLSFMEEEDDGIELDNNSTKAARELGKNCAVMKIMSHKSISLDSLRKNMRMLWKPNKGVQNLRHRGGHVSGKVW